jgi:hypothetical protein
VDTTDHSSRRLGDLAPPLLASTCLMPINPTVRAQNGERIGSNANVTLTASDGGSAAEI